MAMQARDDVEPPTTGVVAELPSGGLLEVKTDEEATWVETTTLEYRKVFSFENPMDLNQLDRIVALELILWRMSRQVARGYRDEPGQPVLFSDVREDYNRTSAELRQLQKDMGLNKATRDKVRGEDSVPVYLATLRTRALQFGISRNLMQERSINLVNDLLTMVTYHDNLNDEERIAAGLSLETIVEWLREVMFPEFAQIDADFRVNQQSWVRTL